MNWRQLEKEIITILKDSGFHIEEVGGEPFISIAPFDFTMRFSIETFAKELAKRMEKVS